MYIRKLPYAREKFDKYTKRRHEVIRKLTPFLSIMINDQNIYGYKVIRKLSDNPRTIPLKLLEVYGHSEFRTLNIDSLINNQENTKTFTARINEIEIHRELINSEADLTMDYLLENGDTKRKFILPAIHEIAEATRQPLTVRDRIAPNRVPDAFFGIDTRLRQFEINIGALVLRNLLENNR